jgi:hypothetical protein
MIELDVLPNVASMKLEISLSNDVVDEHCGQQWINNVCG